MNGVSLTAFFDGFLHQFGRRFLEIVCPSDFGEQLNPKSGDVETVCQFGRLVVPWEYVVIVVPALAHRGNRHNDILRWIDLLVVWTRSPPSILPKKWYPFMHLSSAILRQIWNLAYMCAALFTSHVKFSDSV